MGCLPEGKGTFIQRRFNERRKLHQGKRHINATAMCQAAGKKMSHYLMLTQTTAFIDELSADTGIPASELIHTIKGGIPRLQWRSQADEAKDRAKYQD